MSSSPPANLFGGTPGDRLMMQEILELLAADSAPTSEHNTTALSTGSSGSSSYSRANTHIMNFGPADCMESFTGMADLGAIDFSDVVSVLVPGSLAQAAVGQYPPFATPTVTTRASQDAEDKPAPALPLRPTSAKSAAPGTSHVLPTGQRLHIINKAEFDESRRKLRMQTASRRYRKRKKEEARQKKKQIQELKAELARLLDVETQLKQYEQRSVESLEEELAEHKQEVADLSVKIGEASQEELDWIRTMGSQLRK